MAYRNSPQQQLFSKQRISGLKLLLFMILSGACIFLDLKTQYLDQVRRGLTLALTPFHYMVSGPSRLFDWVQFSVTSHEKLAEANSNLRTQLLFLNSQLQRFQALEKENDQLRDLLLSSRKMQGKVLNARILAVAPDPYLSEIVLNKGSRDQVRVGQPVLDAYGVMGQVIRVEPLTSRVLLITDSRSLVPVEIHRNGLRGIAAGKGREKLVLMYVPDTADVRVGDQLLTSGLGDRYPAGYPVAEVVNIERTPEQSFSTITLEPIARLHQSREVLLLWPDKNQTRVKAGAQQSGVDPVLLQKSDDTPGTSTRTSDYPGVTITTRPGNAAEGDPTARTADDVSATTPASTSTSTTSIPDAAPVQPEAEEEST